MSIRVGLRPMGGGRSSIYRPAIYDAYRRSHDIEGSTGGAQTDYQVKVMADFLHAPRELADDAWNSAGFGGNSGFPRAVRFNGVHNRTYIVYLGQETTDENIYIIYYDHDLDQVSDPVLVGAVPAGGGYNHEAPALAINSSGYLFVFWGGEYGVRLERWVMSTNAEDITAWGAANVIAGYCMYSNVFFDSTDRLWHFYRSADITQSVRYSDNDGAAWSAPVALVTSTRTPAAPKVWVYCLVDQFDNLHVAWTSKVDPPRRKDLFYLMSDDSGVTWKKADGTPLALPVNEGTSDKIWDSGADWADHNRGGLDVDSGGNFYVSWDTMTGANRCYIATFRGGSWQATVVDVNSLYSSIKAVSPTEVYVYHSALDQIIYHSKSINQAGTFTVEGGHYVEALPMGLFFHMQATLGSSPQFLYGYTSNGNIEGVGIPEDPGYRVGLAGNSEPDFGDVRFTGPDEITKLDYARIEYVNSVYAIFWYEVDSILADPEITKIYIYYGKDGETDESDADATFIYFADFEDCLVGDDGSCEGFTPLVGATWAVKAGKWYSGLRVGVESWSHAGGAWGDYAFVLKTYLVVNDSNINFRVVDKDNHYLLVIDPDHATRRFVFYKRVAAGYTQLTFSAPTIAMATWHDIEIQIVDEGTGTRFRLYFNENLEINYLEDPRTFASGRIGFRVPSVPNDTYWDDLIVRKYVYPEPSNGDWDPEEDVVWPF